MNAESPYRYPASSMLSDIPTAPARPWGWRLLIVLEVICCVIFVLSSCVVGLFLLVTRLQVSARWDEILLSLLAFATCPGVAWFAFLEVRGIRRPNPQQELLLSRFALLSTIAPVALSVFWFYEYTAFGHFRVNGLPAIAALFFAMIWFVAGKFRLMRARQLIADVPADGYGVK